MELFNSIVCLFAVTFTGLCLSAKTTETSEQEGADGSQNKCQHFRLYPAILCENETKIKLLFYCFFCLTIDISIRQSVVNNHNKLHVTNVTNAEIK